MPSPAPPPPDSVAECPRCGAGFAPPVPLQSACPRCGVWFHKLRPVAEPAPDEPASAPTGIEDAEPAASSFEQIRPAARLALLAGLALWSLRLASVDYTDADAVNTFMHLILLPLHEAGHVFLRPFGEFMTVLGGSLFQVALPLGIGAAFLLRQRDPFGAAVCLWWAGASLVDLAPYVWDALHPQLMLLNGHTGEAGGHDWIYLLDHFGARPRAHRWGRVCHHLGVLTMLAGLAWGLRQRAQTPSTEQDDA